MDRAELLGDRTVAARAAALEQRADMWTALPVIIQSYDEKKQTVWAQPAIKGRLRDPYGKWTWVQLPQIGDAPVHFPSGKNYSITFPITKGDEGLMVFSSRCIDLWWKNGGVQNQADLRMHDLSDGFYIPGTRSQARKLDPAGSTDSLQIRSDDGKTVIDLKDGQISITVDGGTTKWTMTAGDIKAETSGGLLELKADLVIGKINSSNARFVASNSVAKIRKGSSFVVVKDGEVLVSSAPIVAEDPDPN